MRRFRIPTLVVLLAGCTAGEGTGPERVSRIVVTPPQATLTAVGATQQFSAQVLDEGGGAVNGVVVAWRSTNSAIVKVEATGLATAVSEGTASVIAEASGVSGQAEVLVDVPDCTTPQTVSLQPGQVLVTDPPANASCALTLPSGLPGTRYRVAIVRLSSAQTASEQPTATLRLNGRGVIASPPPASLQAPLPALFDARQSALLERSRAIAEATEAVHLRLRAAEEELLRRLTAFDRIAPRSLVLPTDEPQRVSPAKRTFLPRLPSDVQCSPAKTAVTGLLVAQNADIAVYQDSAQAQTAPLSVANVQRMLDFYARYGKATIEQYFGAIPDRDNNAQVVVFATADVANPVAAFVWGGDLLSRSGSTPCPASNEAELVYFNPTLINAPGQQGYQALEALVHEVKHVVSFSQRVSGAVFNTHPAWIEEGSAEVAGEAASRRGWAAAGGPAQNAMVTRQHFQGGGFTPENYGVALRLSRTINYLSTQPNALVVATSQAYSIYGSGWHFHRFLGDAYGGAASAPGADGALFRQQNAASTPPGLAGLQTITGKTYEVLLTEYAAAIMLNGTGAPPPPRPFTTYDFPSATTALSGIPAAPYPYPVTAVGSNPSASFASREWTGPIGNGGLRIHDFVSNGTGTGADITVQVEPPARVVVVRLR